MARDLLSQDIMEVPALLSTRAVLTTMDLMAMVSTTMARGLLMLDTMAMEWLGATSRLTDLLCLWCQCCSPLLTRNR